MHITPEEANFLLFCLDAFCKTDSRGKISEGFRLGYGLTTMQQQDLRDRLMAVHEHPEEGSDYYTRKTLFDPQCGEDED